MNEKEEEENLDSKAQICLHTSACKFHTDDLISHSLCGSMHKLYDAKQNPHTHHQDTLPEDVTSYFFTERILFAKVLSITFSDSHLCDAA